MCWNKPQNAALSMSAEDAARVEASRNRSQGASVKNADGKTGAHIKDQESFAKAPQAEPVTGQVKLGVEKKRKGVPGLQI